MIETGIKALSDEWFEKRMHILTGTDAAAILGCSKWRTPLDVWYRLVLGQGQSKDDNAFLRWGRIMEPIVAQEFRTLTGMTITETDELFLHDDHPKVLGCTPDGFVEDPFREGRGVWEAKAPSAYTADEWDDGKAPEHYVAQIKFNMLVTGCRWGVLCALLPPRSADGDLVVSKHIEFEEGEAEALLEQLLLWHAKHVLAEEQPAAVASDQERLKDQYGAAAARTVFVRSDAIRAFQEAQEEQKRAKEKADGLKAILMQTMGEAMFATDEDGRAVTWKPRTDGRRVFKATEKLPKSAPAPEVTQ